MFSKIVYAINIVLVLIWAYSLQSMWRQISWRNTGTVSEHTVQWVPISKPSHTWTADERNLFDSKPKPVVVKPPPAPPAPSAPVNEKGLESFILRVRGIFTSPEQRFVVIEKVSKKTSKSESARLVAGGSIAGFTVQQIQSDVVTLVDPATGERVVMKIFKPVQDYPGNKPKS